MRSKGLGALLLSGALVLVGAPVGAQDDEADASPKPRVTQVPLQSETGRPDLYLEMPYYMGGYEPEIVMTRGEEHFANLAEDDPTRAELEGLLETVGADISDMVSGYALVSQEGFFSFVVGIRIEGATPGTLLPAYLPILYQDLVDPQASTGRVGDKDVVIISSVGTDDEYVELHVYDEGDTVWMIQGPSDVVEITLDNLPDPLPSSAPAAD